MAKLLCENLDIMNAASFRKCAEQGGSAGS